MQSTHDGKVEKIVENRRREVLDWQRAYDAAVARYGYAVGSALVGPCPGWQVDTHLDTNGKGR